MKRVFLILLSSFILPPSSFGSDLSITLPLGPYYRPGKYIPVHITASITEPGNKWLGLAADNVRDALDITQAAAPPSVNSKDAPLEGVVPGYVPAGPAKRPKLFGEYSPDFTVGPDLHLLGDSERLVGWTTPDESFARRLLHAPPKLMPVLLDPATPTQGNPAAWEMLD